MSLTVGRIPSYYREVYSKLSGSEGGRISRQAWQSLADTASLPSAVLDQVWRQCNRGQDSLGQDGLFKSLALIAVAQLGKPAEDWALDVYAEKDLPIPKLAPLKEPEKEVVVKPSDVSPTTFGYTYSDLQKMDSIAVQIVPEKKGMVFKYQEYLVESKVLKVKVVRRFRDFAAFHECLLCRYPFRLIPRLPPKKIAASPSFIEQRRKALSRFLLLIRRHPVLRDDEIVRYFFSFTGAEVAQHIKERYKAVLDESSTSEYGRTARDHINKEMVARADKAKSQITTMLQTVDKLLGVAHQMEGHTDALSKNMKVCEKELSNVGGGSAAQDATAQLSLWSIGGGELWSRVRKGTRDLAPKFSDIGEKATEMYKKEVAVTEKLAYFYDMLLAYQDLCERREKSHSKHHKALTKVQTAFKEKERMTSQGQRMSPEETDRIERRDDELVRAEGKNFFAIFCLHLESQLVQANLQLLLDVLHDMVTTQVTRHEQLYTAWKELLPFVSRSNTSGINMASSLTGGDCPVLAARQDSSIASSPSKSQGFDRDYSPW